MKEKLTRVTALMLALVMVMGLFAGCAKSPPPITVPPTSAPTSEPAPTTEATTEPAPTEEAVKWYGEDDFGTVCFAEIPEPVFDTAPYYSLMEKLTELSSAPGNEDAIRKTYEALLAEDRHLSTVASLVQIRFYQDYSDPSIGDLLNEIDVAGTELMDALYITLRDMLGTEYGSLTEELIGDEDIVEELREYVEMTPEELALVDQESKLVNDFSTARMKDFCVDVNGKIYRESEVYTISDWDTYNAVTFALAKKKNATLAPYLLELIAIRNKMVENEDCTYAEARYGGYNRDYEPADTRVLHESVKQYIVPVYQSVLNTLYEIDLSGLDGWDLSRVSSDRILDLLEPCLDELSPELGDTLRHLRNCGMYDMDYSDVKIESGFTIGLPEYGDAFIFSTPSGWFYDVETVIHEFGHYNNMVHGGQAGLISYSSLDVQEIHSTGMEALFLDFADQVYGETIGDAVRLYVLYILLSNVIDGCLYDEFQQDVFEASLDHDLTVEEVNRIYRRVAESYGNVFGSDDGQGYGWTDVYHTFEMPFYYVSYAVSAVNALELLALSVEDRDAAVEAYMKLSALEPEILYEDAVSFAGLHSALDEDTLKYVAENVDAYVQGILGTSGMQ